MSMPRSPEDNISTAVGQPPIQRPIGGGVVPELRLPRRRGPSRMVQAAEVIGTVAAVAAGASAIDKLVNGHFPWENPNQGIVVPGETPKPTETITMPSVTPGQSLEVTIPSSPSPTPGSTIPTESFAPSTPAPTETASALEQTLTNWIDGKIKVPKAKMFLLPDGEKARLNVIDSQPQPTEWYPRFQGYFLGTQVVDNHLIAYMGSQDGKGQNYFVPLNIGYLNKGYVGAIFDDPDRSVFPSGQGDLKIVPLEEIEKLMASNFKNDTVVFIATAFTSTDQPDPRVNITELRAQVEVATQYSLWSIGAATGSYKDAALTKKYPMVTGLINHEVTTFDPKLIPNISAFWVPRNDV